MVSTSITKPWINDARKFRECSRFSIKPLPDNGVEEVIEEIGRLEHLEDATEIIAAVS